MSNNLAQKTSVWRASARASGPSNPKFELAHQVGDYYLLVYIILSREKSLLVGGLTYGAAAARLQNEFGSFTLCGMEPVMSIKGATIKGAIPVLPAADAAESLKWWTEVCGFKETFRDATPPTYAGINRGEAYLHIAGMSDKILARKVGDQTMVRLAVQGIEALYAEYQERGGKVHPNGPWQTKPWGPRNSGRLIPMVCALRFRSEGMTECSADTPVGVLAASS